MIKRRRHQQLPATGAARETLREKGQFWTPDWVAEAMVGYLVRTGTPFSVFDPAVGSGAFLLAAKRLAKKMGKDVNLSGTELDPNVLKEAEQNGLTKRELQAVELRDFIFQSPTKKFSGIVANPPYIRHHRLSQESKQALRDYGARLLGSSLDGRAGFHIYFLLKALELLEPSGRLAFIMPADTCEGVFSGQLWRWITLHYKLDAVVTFTHEATPFPGVDTNALILFIEKSSPLESFLWARCKESDTEELFQWVLGGFHSEQRGAITACRRSVDEGLRTGLSRPPMENAPEGVPLGHFARIVRGIATGANEFFLLTDAQISDLNIPRQFFLPAVGRTRDVQGDEVLDSTMQKLRSGGAPTWLLSLDGRDFDTLPKPLQQYIRHGESLGFHKRSLISTRKPWYKMEVRTPPPPFLFAYLGRKNTRFIRNYASVSPLTGFLCVYPKDPAHTEKLWMVLRHSDTIKNLSLVGKSYGGGAIKVEPRSLDRLILPLHLLKKAGLTGTFKAPLAEEQLVLA